MSGEEKDEEGGLCWDSRIGGVSRNKRGKSRTYL